MTQVCPSCGAPIEVIVRTPGGISLQSTTRQERRAQRRMEREEYHRYHSDVVASESPELRPGETLRLSTPLQGPTYEANVGVPLGEAVLYGTGAALISIALPLVFPAAIRWYVPLVVWPVTTGIAIFVTPERARKLLMRVEEWTGVDIDGDGRAGDVDVTVTGEIPKNADGSSTMSTTFKLPASQVRKWRSFCQAVTAGDCNFSGNAAEDAGFSREHFDRILDRWASEDDSLALVDPATVGPRKTPKLTDQGQLMVASFAHSTLPDTITLLEQLVGDR